jgi:hypothetical protein
MLLQYIFFQKFRNIESQGFNLSGRFNISISELNVSVEENSFFIEDFFGESIKDVKILVGENGVGKTSILTYIKEELCFPKSERNEDTKCLLVLYEWKTKKIVLVADGIDTSNYKLVVPKGYRKAIKNVTNRKNPNVDHSTKNSVLGSIKEFNPSSLILLSNVYDNSSTKEYGYPESPFIYDLTTNSLVKQSILEPPRRSLKSSVNYNSMKFVLMTRDSSFIPVVHLPDKITVTFNRILIDDYIRRHERKKKEPTSPLSELIAKWTYQNKSERVQYWLLANLLIEVSEYIQDEDLVELVDKLHSVQSLNDGERFFKILTSASRSFVKSKRSESRKFKSLSDDFSWPKFILRYQQFANYIDGLHKKYGTKADGFDTFDIPLSKSTEKSILNLTEMVDDSEISIPKISLSWGDLSTGETMLLNFFSTLFVMSRKRKTELGKSILFLFDEVDVFYHPQWQKKLMSALIDFISFHFSNYECQIIATAHSPFIISDVPKSNVLFMRRVDKKSVVQDNLDDHLQTFAANIHALLSDSFFLKDGHMGEFANRKISEVIDLLVDGKLGEIITKRNYIEKIINVIGEDVIKAKLSQLLMNRLHANLLSINGDLTFIKAELKKLKKRK